MDSEHEDSLRGVSLSILIEFQSNYASKQMTIKTTRRLEKIKCFDFALEIEYFKPYDALCYLMTRFTQSPIVLA